MNKPNTHITWQPLTPKQLATSTQLLMKTRGLLTMALTAKCGAPLNVEILSEGFAFALPDEQKTLSTSEDIEGWVRSVTLSCKGAAILYARSFIPLNDAKSRSAFLSGDHTFSTLKTLGKRPLGLWLAEHPQLLRTPFSFTIHPTHYWPHCPDHHTETGTAPARQSVFDFKQEKLILTEIFL